MVKTLINWLKTKLSQRPKIQLLAGIMTGLFVFGLLFLPKISLAAFTDDILSGVGSVILWAGNLINSLIATGINLVLTLLTNVASFNDFVNAPAVVDGWVLVRDLCNMFFIVILLVISVGTVLGIESYSYKNFLKKVIFMSILINFSKTIAGALIDVSQVIMLTFVSSFSATLHIGFIEAFGVNKMMAISQTVNPTSGEVNTETDIAIIMVALSIILGIILLMVLISMLVMLAYRIVTLWILVILSPFAYLASALPGSVGSYGKQWWQQFSQQLIVGPALAFFIWLALTIVSRGTGTERFVSSTNLPLNPELGLGLFSQAPFVLSYIMGIMILIIGMKMASSMGGESGAAAGKMFNNLKNKNTYKKAWNTGKTSLRRAGKAARFVSTPATRMAGWGLRKFDSKGKIKEGSLLSIAAARSKDKLDERQKAREKRNKDLMKVVGLGTGSNVMTALADRGARKKAKYIDKEKNNARIDAEKKWDGDLELRNAALKNAVRDKAHKKAEVAWNSLSDQGKSMFNSKSDFIKQREVEAMNSYNNASEEEKGRMMTDLRNEYIKDEQIKAGEKATKDFKPSKFNPFRRFYDIAEGEMADRNQAQRVGQSIANDHSTFEADQVTDKIGDVKTEAIKNIFKDLDQTQVKGLVEYWDGELKKKPEDKKVQKNHAALHKALRHFSEEYEKENVAVAGYYKGSLENKKIYAGNEQKSVKDVELKKSKKDYLLDKDENLDLSNYSQQGLTTGSLKNGGNIAAVNINQLQNIQGVGRLEGDRRAAGMHLTGDDAKRAAAGMKTMLKAQVDELQKAVSAEDIKVALDFFGVKADSGNLEQIKQKVLSDAQKTMNTLSDDKMLDNKGLNLINKARAGRGARTVIRHESAHEMLENIDANGAVQSKAWGSMNDSQRQQARSYIEKDRGKSGMSEGEVMKEWFADAMANSYKPGGPEAGKPTLPTNFGKLGQADNDVKFLAGAIKQALGGDNPVNVQIQQIIKDSSGAAKSGSQPDGGAAAMEKIRNLQAIGKVVRKQIDDASRNKGGNLEVINKLKELDKKIQKVASQTQPKKVPTTPFEAVNNLNLSV